MNGFSPPSYMADIVKTYVPARPFTSSIQASWLFRKLGLRKLGEAAFVNNAPKLWNSLLKSLKGS